MLFSDSQSFAAGFTFGSLTFSAVLFEVNKDTASEYSEITGHPRAFSVIVRLRFVLLRSHSVVLQFLLARSVRDSYITNRKHQPC